MDYLAIAKYVIYKICGGEWCCTLNKGVNRVPICIKESLRGGKAIGLASWWDVGYGNYEYRIDLVPYHIYIFISTCGHEAAHILCAANSNGREIFKKGPRLYEELLCDLAGIQAVILFMEKGFELSDDEKLDIASAYWHQLEMHLQEFRDFKIPYRNFVHKTMVDLEERIDKWLAIENDFKIVKFLNGVKFVLQANPAKRSKVDPDVTLDYINEHLTRAIKHLDIEIRYNNLKNLDPGQRAARAALMVSGLSSRKKK